MGVIKRQGIKNTITGYIGILIGFVNLIVIQPHFLTKEELGLTRILYSFSLLVAMFVPLGIGNATIKYFPQFKDPAKKHHGFFGFMNLFPALGFLLAALLLWIFRDFFLNQYRRESPLFVEYFDWVFPLIFFNAFIAVLSVYCNTNYKSTIPAFLNDVVVRILTIVVVSVYFLQWINLDQFIALFVGIYALQFIGLLIYIFSFDKPGLTIDWKILKEKKIFDMMKFGMLLWFASVASIGLKYFDSIMIGKYMPLSFVGIYTIAAFIPTVIETPLNAFDKIAAAKISFAWADGDHKQIREIYHKSSLYMFLLGGFLFLNININIHTLLQFLPSGYEQGEWVVLIISIGTLFNMATGLNASILFNSDKYRYGAVFLISLAVLVLILQMVLIPLKGIIGAAIATSAASLIYNTMLFVSVWKFFKLQPFDQKNVKVLVVLLLCLAIGYSIPHLGNKILDITLRSSVTSLIFFLAIYFMNVVPEFHRHLPWEKKN
ncbi:MAG: oligosaccharide flippase family protein [Bacteroidetes bacterium]|nr:oligosaccharide flippase family protein [Bacteroidota bacterium]